MSAQAKSFPGSLKVDTARFSPGRALNRILVYALLLFGVVMVILPLVWMVSTSLKPTNQVFKMPPQWIPDPIQWSNYEQALLGYNPNFLIFIRNTLFIEVLVVPGILADQPLAAYSFSRLRGRARPRLYGDPRHDDAARRGHARADLHRLVAAWRD
ncbi:MAG: hypothetical protein LC121_17110 [Anaerolineae bacterium]|nr:hypothetical protein [Anaerolineae bacterium]